MKEEEKKVKIEYEMDVQTFRHVLDAIWDKYHQEVCYIPGERLSAFLQYLLDKKKQLLL